MRYSTQEYVAEKQVTTESRDYVSRLGEAAKSDFEKIGNTAPGGRSQLHLGKSGMSLAFLLLEI